MTSLGIETEEKIKALLNELPNQLKTQMEKLLGPLMEAELPQPKLQYSWNNEPLITISKQAASRKGMAHFPSPVQQNVPAYGLFGVFFIVLPLAGSLLKERHDGIMARLLTMPVSAASLIGGKISAYMLICFCQFAFIAMLGKFILPALGTDTLQLGSNYGALGLLCLCSVLAAIGYGILLGSLCRTFKQVSTIGPISVVIAAALGGVMVPVHAMPEIMQNISKISPLNWGLEAFLELLIKDGSLLDIVLELCLLTAFFLITAGIGIITLFSRVRHGQ